MRSDKCSYNNSSPIRIIYCTDSLQPRLRTNYFTCLSNVTDIPSSISWAIIPNANVTAVDEFDSSPTNLNQVLTNTTTTTQIVEYVISMDTNQGGCTSLKLSDIKSSLVHKLQLINQVEICSTDNLITLLKVIWRQRKLLWSRDAVVGIQNNASTGSTKYINEDLVNTTSAH